MQSDQSAPGAKEAASGHRLIFLMPSLALGGAEKVASLILPILSTHFSLTLALLENRRSYPVAESMHLVAFSKPLGSRAAHIFRIPYHLAALLSLVKRHKPSIVLSFMEQANILNLLAATMTGHRAVISQRIAPRQQFTGRGVLGRLILETSRRLYPRAAHIITVSCGVRDILLADYELDPNRVSMIPNPVNLDILAQQADAAPSLRLPPKFILHVGRLSVTQKAQVLLLEAFSRIHKKDPNLTLVLVGDGPDKALIERQIQSLGLSQAVQLTGWQSNVAAIMARAQLLVLCSHYEGWPNVLIEAMACGCPVVATDCPTGPREILRDSEFGILAPTDDPEALAVAIGSLLSDNRRRLFFQGQARRRAVDFDVRGISSQYVSLLARIIHEE
jgi:N-acetylgalactosamine-N,N'-diacetylbacillosaminyl-diphospho-undecaprenol 4-alpha-N-acetylgalactosaminyltransferase